MKRRGTFWQNMLKISTVIDSRKRLLLPILSCAMCLWVISMSISVVICGQSWSRYKTVVTPLIDILPIHSRSGHIPPSAFSCEKHVQVLPSLAGETLQGNGQKKPDMLVAFIQKFYSSTIKLGLYPVHMQWNQTSPCFHPPCKLSRKQWLVFT